MSISVYVILCLAAALSIIQAKQQSPVVFCGIVEGPPITRDDCKKSLRKFSHKGGFISWSDSDVQSCGTCKMSITQPSLPNQIQHTARYHDVLIAIDRGMDKCGGKPANATFGTSEHFSVLLNPAAANGDKCLGY
ncbi:hypothetical protein PTTG_11936 [Puccinia triticina 1-1 BBBD Race 1]|uniref:Uncharacterized protein n=2 Tax=Puccinia triticina TaxID=208348 RepID=A0A180H3M9_PUCT1|nr:hypothetical protein PTTG_11936 [Puccinia triticina 1-1 BBBD Race 1]WAR54721.1 hypothetical protein PtB15_4B338 [Puccinia triticina]